MVPLQFGPVRSPCRSAPLLPGRFPFDLSTPVQGEVCQINSRTVSSSGPLESVCEQEAALHAQQGNQFPGRSVASISSSPKRLPEAATQLTGHPLVLKQTVRGGIPEAIHQRYIRSLHLEDGLEATKAWKARLTPISVSGKSHGTCGKRKTSSSPSQGTASSLLSCSGGLVLRSLCASRVSLWPTSQNNRLTRPNPPLDLSYTRDGTV